MTEYRDPEREAKRLRTIRQRYGENFTIENARKAGRMTPTKFNSQTASEAAKKRWEKKRAEQARKGKLNG